MIEDVASWLIAYTIGASNRGEIERKIEIDIFECHSLSGIQSVVISSN